MRSLADTISEALARLGHGPRDVLLDSISVFEGLGLSDEERVCVIASALAGAAVTHHDSHVPKLLEAIRLWSLELAAPNPPRIDGTLRGSRMAEGLEIVTLSLDELMAEMLGSETGLEDRVVIELTFFARLLAHHDAHTILLILASVAEVLGGGEFQAGDLLSVPLRDPFLDRTTELDDVLPRGNA